MSFPAEDFPEIPDPLVERPASLPIEAEQISPDPTALGPELRLISAALPNEPRDPVWTGLDVFRLTIIAILAIMVSGLAMLAVVHGATFKARILRLSALPELLIVAQMLFLQFDDPKNAPVRPTMAHFFYMDPADPTKVIKWIGAVGPTGF